MGDRLKEEGYGVVRDSSASDHTETHTCMRITHTHMTRFSTPNRDGRALRQIETPVDDKVEMDWLTCPCHVAPCARNSEEDGWIPWQEAG